MTLAQFVEEAGQPQQSLVVVNREAPRPVQGMLEDLFSNQPVTVKEYDNVKDADSDIVYLIEDGEVLAHSSLEALQESILFVNSDLYVTGARKPTEVEVPAVLEELVGVRFRVRGYPESHTEKLLLITISRYIERLAIETERGKHRASFQRLSRIKDEQGTQMVYEQLADSPVDTHVYGVPDWTPPPQFELTMHGGWDEEFQDVWFVSFVPDQADNAHMALVAIEQNPQTYEGFWTDDSERVRQINRYIEREL